MVDTKNLSVVTYICMLMAGMGLILGPFLSWINVGILSASGVQKTGNEALVLTLLGVLGVIAAILALVKGRDMLRWAPFVIGGLASAFSLFFFMALSAHAEELSNEFFSPTLGAGLYICLGSGPLMILGTLGFARPRSAEQEV